LENAVTDPEETKVNPYSYHPVLSVLEVTVYKKNSAAVVGFWKYSLSPMFTAARNAVMSTLLLLM
jgi:hypothetical protein